MTKADREWRMRLHSDLSRLKPELSFYAVFDDAEAMRKLATRSHSFAEANCCREVSQREITADSNRDKRMAELAAKYGCGLYVQGDPRGCPYYLLPPGVTADNYNNGIAVPW